MENQGYSQLIHHNQADELAFLRGLGSWSRQFEFKGERLRLLRLYLVGMGKRVEWGKLDRAGLEAAVRREIEREVQY